MKIYFNLNIKQKFFYGTNITIKKVNNLIELNKNINGISMETDFLFQAIIYLSAAVVFVPIAKKLGMSSILGYLLAGIIIGPSCVIIIRGPAWGSVGPSGPLDSSGSSSSGHSCIFGGIGVSNRTGT